MKRTNFDGFTVYSEHRLPRWIRKQGLTFKLARFTLLLVLVPIAGLRKLTRGSASILAASLPVTALIYG